MKEYKSQYRLCRDLFESTSHPYYFMLANCYENLVNNIVALDKENIVEDELTL